MSQEVPLLSRSSSQRTEIDETSNEPLRPVRFLDPVLQHFILSRRSSQVSTQEHTPGAVLDMHAHNVPNERLCFICLDGTDDRSDVESSLVPCCSRCFAVTHPRCWKEWRRSQANYARRNRVAGNQINSDPFVCSICKSGSSRVTGELVSVRWLEAFASFSSSARNRVRVASGLFSALTGARQESHDEGDLGGDEEDQEGDFLDFIEEEQERGSGTFFCGDSKKFHVINFVLLITFGACVVSADEIGVAESSYIMLLVIISVGVYVLVLATYIFVRFQSLANRRRIQGNS